MNTQAMKQSLRQSIIATRLKISEQDRHRLSQQITARITDLEAYQSAKIVLGYLNFGAEFSAEILLRQAIGDGKQVLLPKVNSATRQLDIYRVSDLERDVAPGLWNIREPLPERCTLVEDLARIDFILLPGVAFSRDGARLGYGGGFYDKLLARLTHQSALVAAAFAMQIVESIPQEVTDCKVECLVSECETVYCAD